MGSKVITHFKQIVRSGYDFGLRLANWGLPPDFSPADIEIINEVAPFTMTSPERIYALCQSIEYIIIHKIPGDIVECGVWKGGSMMAVARLLLRHHDDTRHLYLYDTFEGMPAPGNVDRDFRGRSASNLLRFGNKNTSRIWAYSPVDQVREALRGTGYDDRRMHFIKGKVEETLPSHTPEQISLLRLDTDWYESTLCELTYLYPKLVIGGVIIIDDYGYWQGARRAVDQYFAEHKVKMLLNRIDFTGRVGIKTEDQGRPSDGTGLTP